MTVYVGSASGNKVLLDPKVGDSAGVKRDVQTIWVGTAAGNKMVYTRRPDLVLAAAVVSYKEIGLTWTDLGAGHTYDVMNTTTGAWVIQNTTLRNVNQTNLSPSKAYSFRVDGKYGGAVVDQSTASATTPARPTVQKYIELEAVSSASYNGSGANRNVNECYYGYYSSNQGQQKSLWCFNIPADARNCISIDRIDLLVYNIHAFLGSGGSTGLVIHHGAYQGGFPATFPGSTGILLYNGSPWYVSTPKPGYTNGGWMTNVQVLTSPGRPSMAEEFRVNGADGFGLASPDSSTSHYGYAGGAPYQSGQRPAMRLWYTVYSA